MSVVKYNLKTRVKQRCLEETGEAKSKMISCGSSIPREKHRTKAGESWVCNRKLLSLKSGVYFLKKLRKPTETVRGLLGNNVRLRPDQRFVLCLNKIKYKI